MTDTTELVKRLEAGETGREIDIAICRVLRGALVRGDAGQWEFVPVASHGSVAQLSTSLDAALALVEMVRPGCDWSVAKVGPNHRANLWMPSALRLMPSPHCTAPTPAAALLAALLKAEG